MEALTGWLAVLLALAAGLSDLAAGWLAFRAASRFGGGGSGSMGDPRYLIAFASGVLLAVVFFDVLPEVDLEAHYGFLALGFFTFYVLEKAMMLHACGEAECEAHAIGPVAVVGMALDNVVDGVGIATGFLVDPWLGGLIALAVVLHEVPQGMASALIMRAARWPRRRIYGTLALAGALYPVGALLAGLLPEGLAEAALAFVAGDFLYIGAGDLLPEAHRRFNVRVILAVLAGVALVLALKLLLPAH